MKELWARSLSEAHLYLHLNMPPDDPRPVAEVARLVPYGIDWVVQVTDPDGDPTGTVIRLADRPLGSNRLGADTYGSGDEPSTLIDAGQWRIVEVQAGVAADEVLRAREGDALSLDAYESVAHNLDLLLATVVEIGKFLPAGADEVPAEAFWTPDGREARALQPEAFQRARIEADRTQYEQFGEQLQLRFGPWDAR